MDNSSNCRSTCFLSMAAGAAGATPGGYAGAADSYSRSHRAVQSADFFCGIVPGSVLSQLGKAMNLEGAAGLAMKRLSREGLSWVPTAGNLCTLVAFGIALYINHYLTSESCGRGAAARTGQTMMGHQLLLYVQMHVCLVVCTTNACCLVRLCLQPLLQPMMLPKARCRPATLY
jgi:hypothetical protein